MGQLYDRIGAGYSTYRTPDPRIAAALTAALGDARSVVNVGAGTGSYEPTDRRVLAVEPSRTMIRQRPRSAHPVVRASANDLPLRDGAFDAALAVLTIHHWPDRARGLAELQRVARRRVVLLTHAHLQHFWLMDYFPGIERLDRESFPTDADMEHVLGPLGIRPVPVPHDCRDGFLGAYWRRPYAYLDPDVRAAISTFSKLAVGEVRDGIERLRADLASGAWRERYGALLVRATLDVGYRIVVAQSRGRSRA